MAADDIGRTTVTAQIESLRSLISAPQLSVDTYWDQIKRSLTAIYETFVYWASGIGSRTDLPDSTIVEESNGALDDLLPELKRLERWLERNSGGNHRWITFSQNIKKARDGISQNEYSIALFIFLQWIRVYEGQHKGAEQWLIEHEDDQNRRFVVATVIAKFADDLEQAIWLAESSNNIPPTRPRRTPSA